MTYLMINGEVITVNASNEVALAVAISKNKIVAVGDNEKILELKDRNTKVIDLGGRTLMPGFIDSHIHITLHGTNELSVSCKDERINSIKDLIGAMKEQASKTQTGKWIRAWGYNESKFKEKRFPTKEELDSVSTEHPIILTRTCNHISVVNSRVLEEAGLTGITPDPAGGRLGREENGKLNGLLIESAHMDMFAKASFSNEEMKEAHTIASKQFAEKGITSIHEASGFGLQNIRQLQTHSKEGIIKQRLYVMIGALNGADKIVRSMNKSAIFTGLGDDKYRIGPVKLFLDGSSSGPTIWTRDPYTSDADEYGVQYYEQEEVDEIFIPAHKNGWQITAHAQGDAAIDMLLNTIEKANNLHPRPDARHRIEHAGIASPDLIQRMKEQNVIPTPNPAFLYEFGDGYAINYGERTSNMYPLNDYLEADVPAAFGSDCPVTTYSPMRGIHAALTRMTQSGQVLGKEKTVSLMDTIRMYTLNGAYASFEEDIKGSIEIGKLADLILLDSSLLSADVDDIPEIKVEWTMIDGEVVYSRKVY